MSYGWNSDFSTFETPAPPASAKLELWSEQANMLFAAGCEPQAFLLLSSLASPLHALFSTREGGVIISLHGSRKAGKSVALAAAASVWAKPEALDGIALVQARHLPVIATMLLNRDPTTVSIYLSSFLTEIPKDAERLWATCVLSISGESLQAIVPEMPMIELELRVPRGLIGDDKTKPSVMERKLVDNRGIAGAKMIEALTQPDVVPWARKMLASKYALMVDELRLGPEKRFQMRAIAAAWVAGDIAARIGVIEASPERIARWVMEKVFAK